MLNSDFAAPFIQAARRAVLADDDEMKVKMQVMLLK